MDGGRNGRRHYLLCGLTLCGVLAIGATSSRADDDEQLAFPSSDEVQAEHHELTGPRVVFNNRPELISNHIEQFSEEEDEDSSSMRAARPIRADHPIYADDFRRGVPAKSRHGRVIKAQHAMPDESEIDGEMPPDAMESVEGLPPSIDSDLGANFSPNSGGGARPWGPSPCNDGSPECGACCAPCAPCAPPYWTHKTGVWGEYQYLRPRNAEVPYAVPIDGPVAPVIGNGIQNGPTATVNPGYQSAFAVGGSWALSDFSSIRVRYAHFSQLTTDSATIAPPDVLRALVTHPLGTNAATDTLDATASLTLSYDIGDVLYAGVLWGGDNFVVNYFGGGRYLNFEQNFSAIFSTIGTTPVASNVDFNGGGIQLGIDGERRNCRTGLLVYGRAGSSFVVGQFDANYQQSDAAGVAIVANSFNAARIVPMLDMELGVGWTGRQGRLRLTAGYVIQAWFNTVTTNDYIQAVQVNNFNGLSNTVTFDGLTVRGTLQF